MNSWPILTPKRAAVAFREMIGCRRDFCADTDFFRMPEVWDYLCGENGDWKIKEYRSSETEDFKRKAGVISFNGRVTLSVDERLMENARGGCKLSNFILAHELGHLGLNHHARGAVTKNFQLFAGPNGMSNMPPTLEELETNYAAAFFQCGTALLDQRWGTLDLAHRACSDVSYVRKAQAIVRQDAFRRALQEIASERVRVVL